eukprot:CAMPEP_0113962676 /NCGR_PEP_ID=MMETSP0011_2-20120614/6060_1 /TAXON_ID=101924 /ORGANISM="Rhodosorus marinus" /LENGTH=158 /DNA_ID=CAMNT_0000974581 /DNA_START=243 /DNA_END=715 /DNA_ORIENTATION=- /assembly_acc=CAM_ASM_000156
MEATGGATSAASGAAAGAAAEAGAAGAASSAPQLKLPELKVNLKQFERTFLCIGPICLRSGMGVGAGVGCGVGIGKGYGVYKFQPGSEGTVMGFNPYNMLGRLPGGYMLLNVLRTVQQQFSGASTGVGCGIGIGYGVGIGLTYGRGGQGMGMGGGMGG